METKQQKTPTKQTVKTAENGQLDSFVDQINEVLNEASEHGYSKTQLMDRLAKKHPRTGAVKGGAGIQKTIAEIVAEAGKDGITRDAILSKLSEKFPDRSTFGLASTIGTFIPGGIAKKYFAVERMENGKYRKK